MLTESLAVASQNCQMFYHRLQILEYIFIAGSVVGCIVAVASGQLTYAVVPLSMSLLLNLINRLRFEQRMKRRFKGAIAQLHRQLLEESHTLHKQQCQDAIASLKAQLPEYLAQLYTIDSLGVRGQGAGNRGQGTGSRNQRVGSREQGTGVREQGAGKEIFPGIVKPSGRPQGDETSTVDLSGFIVHGNEPSIMNPEQGSEDGFPPHLKEKEAPPPPFVESFPVEPPTWNPLHTLTGHSDWVPSLAITPDGQTLVSASFDKTVKLWQLSTGQLTHTCSEHSKGVLCVAISPDGQTLASGSFDETIKLWRLDTGELIHTFTGHTGSVRSLAISPNSQLLISGSFDKTIKLWNLDTGKLLGTLTKTEPVSAIALTPDGQTLASGGLDGIITLWQISPPDPSMKLALTCTFTGNFSSVCSLAISPDGQLLAAGCTDGNVKLWQLDRVEPLTILQCHLEPVMSVVFSLDAQTLCSGGADGTIKIWHLKTGTQLAVLTDDSTGSIMSIATSPDGKLIAGGGADSIVRIWQNNG